MRGLATTVETIVDENDCGLHILDMNLALKLNDGDPYQRVFLNTMRAIVQPEANIIRERTHSGIEAVKQADKHTKHPPFSFGILSGYLISNED